MISAIQGFEYGSSTNNSLQQLMTKTIVIGVVTPVLAAVSLSQKLSPSTSDTTNLKLWQGIILVAKRAYCKSFAEKREWIFNQQPQMNNDLEKGKDYWIDEIAFLEARLNGSQGEIDAEDRSACEQALKTAKSNLSSWSNG